MSIIHEALKKLQGEDSRPEASTPLRTVSREGPRPLRRVGRPRVWILSLLLLMSFAGGALWGSLREERPPPPEETAAAAVQRPALSGKKDRRSVASTLQAKEVTPSAKEKEMKAVSPGRSAKALPVHKSRSSRRRARLARGRKAGGNPAAVRREPEKFAVASAPRARTAGVLTAQRKPPSPYPTPAPPQVPPRVRTGPASAPAAPNPVAGSMSADGLFRRGVQLTREEKIAPAEKAYEAALKLDPRLKEAANNLGTLYFQQHLYEKSIAAFKQALSADPGYARAHNNLGIVYTKKGQMGMAVKEYQAALAGNPKYAAPYYNLAWLHARRGEYAISLDYLKRAFQLDPGLKGTAKRDPDLSSLRGRAEFLKLVGP